jgi:hypothetical protein
MPSALVAAVAVVVAAVVSSYDRRQETGWRLARIQA